MSDFAAFSIILGALTFVVVVILGVVGGCTYAVDKGRCAEWGEITGREVRFERTSAVTWDCFTRDSDGTWLPITQVRDIG